MGKHYIIIMGLVKYHNRPYKAIGFPSFFDDDFVRDFFNHSSESKQIKHHIKQDTTSYWMALELPGFAKEDVNIELKGNELHVSSKVEDSSNGPFAPKAFTKAFIVPRSVARK